MEKFVIVLFILFFSLSSCKKDEAVGPQGLTGATGPTGVTGPTGATGATGETGNVNIITIQDTVMNWTAYGTTYISYKTVISSPAITQGIVDSGMVFVYIYGSINNFNYGWVLLPASNIIPYPTWNCMSNYYLNTVEIHFITGAVSPPGPGTRVFKIVIVDGNVMRQNPDINWSDDEQVEKIMLTN